MKEKCINIFDCQCTNAVFFVLRVLGLFFLFVCPASVHAKENAAIGYDDHTYAVLPVFVLFFITFILVIVFLSVSLIHCRRKLRQCHENLLRCITENLELKKNIPNSERTNLFNLPDITPEEFIKVMDMMLKRMIKNR